MTFKVDIKDYLCIKRASLDFDRGITVIQGKNNSGKTSIFRAIDDAIFNVSTPDDDIRVNQPAAIVRISNGKDSFIWKRKAKGKSEKTAYQINNNPAFTKVGRLQLEEIAQLFNITEVRMSNNIKEKVNFLFQGDPPFLTKKTPGQLFEFFSITASDNYIRVLKRINSDINSLKSDIVTKAASMDMLKEINRKKKELLDANEGFDDLYKQIVITNKEVERLNRIEELAMRIESTKDRRTEREEVLTIVLDKINEIDIETVNNLYREVSDLSTSVQVLENLNDKLIAKREQLITAKRTYLDVVDKYKSFNSYFNEATSKLTEIEKLDKDRQKLGVLVDNIDKKTERYKKVSKSLDRINEEIGSLKIGEISDEIKEIEELEALFIKLKTIKEGIDRLKGRLNNKKQEYAKIVKDYDRTKLVKEEYEKEIGVCPLCERSF